MSTKHNGWDPGSLLNSWIEAGTDYWLKAAKDWTAMPNMTEGFAGIFGGPKSQSMDSWLNSLKMWQSMASGLGTPDMMESLFKGAGASPEITTKMLRVVWGGYFNLYEQWLKKVGKIGETTEAYKFENLDQEIFKSWVELYEKEIQPYFHTPQLGLTRLYQERMNLVMDKFNLYRTAVSEFLHLIYAPLEKSVHVMQEKFDELSKEGQLSENFKDYYNMWIKILEGHYMTLFKSPQYLQTLSRTLNAVTDFKAAQHEVLVDAMNSLPIPTNKDMDALYKEFYLLKKKVKELEKKLEEKD